ncbi:immunoglobulin-like domain-containing protein [Rubellicoccus peritrichatus]|uniref:DUF5011 domain-containing protein n=1 Tax=Rubellicoccus peritrichatus TaxID=3080537 RepID=A0AAQ3LBI4_9BACT|nr:immunoglobulin-like domain-containing protein [Puniceicoccus sp. CR14]WOO41484.1 DUF5011 domain-containing protein [Puniceicoccus sp. CR14]
MLQLVIGLLLLAQAAFADPDTTTNRHATVADAAFWPTVNEGDLLIFEKDAAYDSIYLSASEVSVGLGKKIHIWQGVYGRIYINGTNCTNTAQQPTVITNLGGQVRWGDVQVSSQYRTFEIANFEHFHLTGKYDPAAQTGHPDFLGHNGGQDFDTGDFYEKYGFWGNQRWSGILYGPTNPNCVRAYGFVTCKVDYVAAWGGGFAGFNLKTDNPAVPERVVVDVQDTFSGFTNGEGMYVSYSTSALGQDITELILRNNIIVFAGTEAIQTDNLAENSIIENNIIVGTATTYRDPFFVFQNGTHQFSHVEGGVTVRDNIFVGGKHNMQTIRWRETESGRTFPDASKKVIFDNNYVGMGRFRISIIEGSDGIAPYEFTNNVYGHITFPHTMDSDPGLSQPLAGLNISNSQASISLEGNLFNPELPTYEVSSGNGSNVSSQNNTFVETPIIKFQNSGFADDIDYRAIVRWAPTYGTVARNGEAIEYKTGDIVYYWDTNGQTKFFECIADNAGNNDPNNSPAYWQQLTWNGRDMPPLDLRLKSDTFYNYRGMGLTYNPANQSGTADYEAPVITLTGGDMSVLEGSAFVDPGFIAIDNVDGDMTDQVQVTWVGAPINVNVPGQYIIRYELPVTDVAGNVAEAVYRTILVSEPNITVSKEVKVNMHRYGAANLPDWTDLANDSQGLRTAGNPTTTTLYDINGATSGWSMLIENINGGYSEHYKSYKNAAGRVIDEFPSEVTRVGLRIRNPYENPCVFVLTGLDPNSFYDVTYTGYREGVGEELTSSLLEYNSGAIDSINIKDNSSEIGRLENTFTDAAGRMDLEFFTTTPDGQPNIGGVIFREKTGFGSAGGHPTIGAVSNLALGLGAGSGAIAITLSDSDSVAGDLSVWAVSSDPSVVDASDVVISGTGLNRTMTIQSNGGLGSATVTLIVSDGYNTGSVSFMVTVSSAAVFSQNFDSSSNVASYVGSGSLALGKLDDISAESNGGNWSVVDGALQIVRGTSSGSSNDAGLARVTDDVLGDPDLLHFSVDMALSNVGNVWNELFVIELGNWSSVTNYGSGGSYSSIYQRLEVKGDGAGEFKLRIASTNSAMYLADGSWGKLDWYVNRSGSSVNYTDPNGQQQSLAADRSDIWLEGQLLFNDITQGSFSGTAINDFRVRFSSSNSVTASFDDLVIKDVF